MVILGGELGVAECLRKPLKPHGVWDQERSAEILPLFVWHKSLALKVVYPGSWATPALPVRRDDP